jgi:hypothetical protein
VKRRAVKVRRPLVWEDVKLKPIPFQDGEDAEDVEIMTSNADNQIIPDPLGLKELDLFERQEAFAAGRISVKANRRRMTAAGGPGTEEKNAMARKSSYMNHVYESDSDEEDDGFGDLSSQSSDDEPSSPSLRVKTPGSPSSPNSKLAARRQTTSPAPKKCVVITSLVLHLHTDLSSPDLL